MIPIILITYHIILLCCQVTANQSNNATRENHFEGRKLISSISKVKLNQEYSYATFFASLSFVPALEVFLYTFAQSQPLYPLTVCIPMTLDHKGLITKVVSLLGKYDNIQWTIQKWPIIKAPKNGKEHPRWTINWTKLQLWNMTQYKSIFYVDLDVIFFNNVDHVFHMKFKNFRGTYDWGRWTPIGKRKLNGGVFLVEPSIDMFSKLLGRMQNVSDYNAVEAEQGLINRVFRRKNCCLPIYFNFQKTLIDRKNPLLNEKFMNILHFTGEKPWISWSTSYFRNQFVTTEEKTRLMQWDQWDADDYIDLHDKWKQFYILARSKEFKQLTIFQGYTKDFTWEHVNKDKFFYKPISLNGILRDKSDLDAQALAPALLNSKYQMAVDEFGSLLAISAMNYQELTPFIGFSNWEEKFKENWKEGASIDYTKIDFKENTIYFWFSLYGKGKSYYKILDNEHPGMLKVLRDLVPFPLPPMNDSNYIYGNYFITTKKIFHSYMISANEFKNKFLDKYPIESKCPFTVPENAKHICVGFILARFINIWAVHNKINMVYAVDHPEWRRL